MRVEFNTGRHYSPEGQRIVVEYDPLTGVATFADLDRCVDGVTVIDKGLTLLSEVRSQVTQNYDSSSYMGNRDSLNFLGRERARVGL